MDITFSGNGAALAQRNTTNRNRSLFIGSIYTYLIFFILILMPFQKLAIEVGTTAVDPSNIVFLIFVGSIFFGKKYINHERNFIFFYAGLFLLQLIIFLFGETPTSRYVSGLVWIFSLLTIYGRRRNINIDERLAFNTTIWAILILVFSLVFQRFLLDSERPSGLMTEPSSAGLVALSGAAGLLIAIRFSKNRYEKYGAALLAVVLIYIAYYLKTTHFFSFVVTILVISFFSKTYNARTGVTIAVLIALLYFTIGQDSHYTGRIDVSEGTTNLSLLSWLQGFDQMKESLVSFPVVGAGLGATGYFYFLSENSDALFRSGIAELNRFDAYSGFFRLVIELGPVFMIIFLTALWQRLQELRSAVSLGHLPMGTRSMHRIFLFTFSFCLIVGVLLKEPTWSKSQVVVGFLLFFTTPLGAWQVSPVASRARRLPRFVATQRRFT